MSITNVTKDTFEEEVLKSDKTVLIDFWAVWCGPCRMVAPSVEAIAAEREDVKVCKVNVDEEPELAMKFNIMSIPTMMVFKNGEATDRVVGAVPKSEIEKVL